MFQEYDTFLLAQPLDDTTIPTGTRGVVLMVLGGDPVAYEVEFPDGRGGNLGTSTSYTVTAAHMEPDKSQTNPTPP